MKLRSLQRHWEQFAADDPLWAILTHPEKDNRRWNLNEFFQSGVQEFDEALRIAESHGLPLSRKRAIDFGCGVGRLTQAIAVHFEEVVGIDISTRMVELARQYNRHGERCRYVVNDENSLRAFPDRSFDFIYSNMTLQHIRPRHTENYLRDFLRMLAPGGLLLFQLPSDCTLPRSSGAAHAWWRSAYYTYSRILNPGRRVMEMYAIPATRVMRLLERNGGEILDMQRYDSSGPGWRSFRYAVTRDAPAPIAR